MGLSGAIAPLWMSGSRLRTCHLRLVAQGDQEGAWGKHITAPTVTKYSCSALQRGGPRAPFSRQERVRWQPELEPSVLATALQYIRRFRSRIFIKSLPKSRVHTHTHTKPELKRSSVQASITTLAVLVLVRGSKHTWLGIQRRNLKRRALVRIAVTPAQEGGCPPAAGGVPRHIARTPARVEVEVSG
jgi:hypothetical protein